MSSTFSTDHYDIVLMEIDQDGFFVREIEKYTLEHPEYVDSFWLVETEGLAICQLTIVWDIELDDEAYELAMEAYCYEPYDALSGLIGIDEKENFEPCWQITFLYTGYEETKKWLVQAIQIHMAEIEKIKILISETE